MVLSSCFHVYVQNLSLFYSYYCLKFRRELSGLSYWLRGRFISFLSPALPLDLSSAKESLASYWESVVRLLNIQKGSGETGVTVDAATAFLSTTERSLHDMRKEQLLELISSVGRRTAASLRKTPLVTKIMDLQHSVRQGHEELCVQSSEPQSEEEVCSENGQKVLSGLYRTSFESWVMKPLVATAGMKEGTTNEAEVLKAIRGFFETNAIINLEHWSDAYCGRKLRVDVVRSVGLLASGTATMVAESTDGLIGHVEESGETYCCAVEIKTMTSPPPIGDARKVRNEFTALSEVRRLETTAASTCHFRKLVTKTEYRLQCLHHSACLENGRVLFLVAKGSSMGVGEIIYAMLLHFTPSMRNNYLYCLDSTRVAAFTWVSRDAAEIPKAYDELLKNSHASDLFSFASFFNLSKAYTQLVNQQGPLPPARMMRPIILVYWNALKGGVDEFSRAMKSLTYTNASENPIVSVLGRLMSAQVNNAGIIYRLWLAQKKGILTERVNHLQHEDIGHCQLRHNVTKYMTFSEFARGLAKEYRQKYIAVDSQQISQSFSTSQVSNDAQCMKPMYASSAVRKYNRATDRARRLSRRGHEKVKSKARYCSLCSSNFYWKYKGKKYTKKGGSKEKQWCSLCRQPICSHCWYLWHTTPMLTKAVISTTEIDDFKTKVRADSTRS